MSTNSALPQDSIVLVTGVNGYIASHIANEVLQAGYRVRGTVRDASRTQWVVELFDKLYGPGRFELCVVPILSEEGAFTETVKDVSGIVHVASNVSFSPNPHEVVPDVIASTLNILKAAASTPSVKRFVYTSSCIVAGFPQPSEPVVYTSDTWNDAVVDMAWAPPPYEDPRKWLVYAASKVQAEKTCWKFVEDEKPGFEFNSVLQAVTFGKPLREGVVPESVGWIQVLAKGGISAIRKHVAGMAPNWFVDVKDAALLHLSALTNPAITSERVFAYGEPFNWGVILDILRKTYPEQSWPESEPDEPTDLSIPGGRDRSVGLLKALGKDDGFTTLEQSVRISLQGIGVEGLLK